MPIWASAIHIRTAGAPFRRHAMKKMLIMAAKAVHMVSNLFAWISAAVLFFMASVSFVDVIGRYFFHHPLTGAQEIIEAVSYTHLCCGAPPPTKTATSPLNTRACSTRALRWPWPPKTAAASSLCRWNTWIIKFSRNHLSFRSRDTCIKVQMVSTS